MTPSYDRAIAAFSEIELRTDGASPRFTGYAAVFNVDSEPLPFVETIQPGAFGRALSSSADHTFVMDHDDTKLLASRRGKTLTLSEDSRGLLVEADLPNTSYARDLIELHSRGEVRSMSFTFRAAKDGDTWSTDGKRRTISKMARLGHVTALTGLAPAYRQTTASIRSLAHNLDADAEELTDALDAMRSGQPLNEEACLLLARAIAENSPRSWSPAADKAASASSAVTSLFYLLSGEADQPETAEQLKNAIGWLQVFIADKSKAIGTDADRAVPITTAQALADLDARMAALAAS